VVKKMQGLNTFQSAIYSAPAVQNVGGTSALQAAYWGYFSPDEPFRLQTNITATNIPDSNEQELYMKRVYMTTYITNNGTLPFLMEVVWCTCRKNITAARSIQSIVEQGAVSCHEPFISMTSSAEFRNYFKITLSKTYHVRPTSVKKLRCTRNFGNKKLLAGVDLDTTDYNLLKGNKIMMIKIWGLPIPYQVVAAPYNNTCLGPYYASIVSKYYMSFYAMGDSTADNYNGTLLPATLIAGNNVAWSQEFAQQNGANYATPIQTHNV